jgi:hypothetical protein
MTEAAGVTKDRSRLTSPLSDSCGVMNFHFEKVHAEENFNGDEFETNVLIVLIKYIKKL